MPNSVARYHQFCCEMTNGEPADAFSRRASWQTVALAERTEGDERRRRHELKFSSPSRSWTHYHEVTMRLDRPKR